MGSFHDQWMAAWDEVVALPVSGVRVDLQQQLGRARELIHEENNDAERRAGGAIVRDVRTRVRELAA